MQQKRILLFVVVMLVLFAAWFGLQQWLNPQKPPNTDENKPMVDGALHAALGPWDMKSIHELDRKEKEEAAKPVDFGFWDFMQIRRWASAKQPELKPGTRVALGSKDPESPYHLYILFDARGAVVRQVILNKFKATNEETGKPMPDKLLELVPDKDPNAPAYNNVMYHFVGKEAREDTPLARPLATLGQVNWKPSATEAETVTVDGHEGQRISFTTEIDGVEITKVFTLFPKEYHVNLEIRLRKLVKDERIFRYQFVGSRGLPIEGRWYTGTFRNALIATIDGKGNIYRDMQELAKIGVWEGGNAIEREPDRTLRYAGIANQYFASVIVVEKDNPKQDFLTRARPTLEKAIVKGKITSISADKIVIARTDTISETYYFGDALQHAQAEEFKDKQVALRVYTDPTYQLDDKKEPRMLIAAIEKDPSRVQPLWEDDITVRVATEPIELKDDEPVVHKYMLYNGPVKPLLLGYVPANMGVSPELVNRYEERGLHTMTDYHSNGFMGKFASTIQWTWLVVHCTNVMHWVLHKIHWLIPSFGLSIICLTVLVRGMMFPISRKGAMTSIRMQELAPEMKKLQEKFKDDPQAKQLATMELYRKHGVSPFGTCWFMFLQMPIFMGLYYALQESITFRLAQFWPTWIDNLAAPDMLLYWGEWFPLTGPDWYGNFLYIGPYLNLLPIIAVALMIMQQKMMTPPPTDEQQEMQQKMMKYMMVFMGLMFYKVASGLCIYFIASSLWGFAERKLLPKKKPTTPTDSGATPATSASLLSRVIGGAPTDSSTAVMADAPAKGKGRRRGKDRNGIQREEPAKGGSKLQRMRRWFRRKREGISKWWAEVLRQARKK